MAESVIEYMLQWVHELVLFVMEAVLPVVDALV